MQRFQQLFIFQELTTNKTLLSINYTTSVSRGKSYTTSCDLRFWILLTGVLRELNAVTLREFLNF